MENNKQSIKNVKAGNNVYIIQSIKTSSILEQLEITFLALKQMPGRLQEAVNSGATKYSFTETRKELEKLFALTKSENLKAVEDQLMEFQQRYNQYISLINRAIDDQVTLNQVNQYHDEEIIEWFDKNIRIPCKS